MSALCQDQLSYQIRPEPTLTARVIFPPRHRKGSTNPATVQRSVSNAIINNLAYLTCSQIIRKQLKGVNLRQKRQMAEIGFQMLRCRVRFVLSGNYIRLYFSVAASQEKTHGQFSVEQKEIEKTK